MSLTIFGVLGDDLWIDRDGYTYAMSPNHIAWMRRMVAYDGEVPHARFIWDESQVDTLIRALNEAPELDPCTRCATLPILHGGDHCIECAGLVQANSDQVAHIRAVS